MHPWGQTRLRARRRLLASAVLTGLFFAVELAGGFLSNSLALLSDAGHMLGDLAALTLSLISIRWALKEATSRKTFGYYRAEVLATLMNGALLVYVALQVLIEAASRFLSPESVDLRVMLPIAAAGLAVNVASVVLLHGFSDHLVTRSAFYHVLSDAFSSLCVIASGLVMMRTGWRLADPVVSVVIAVLILRNAYLLLKESFDILMEASPAGLEIPNVRQAILDVPGVLGVHDLHVWTIGSGFLSASAHVVVRDVGLRESGAIVERITAMLRERFSIGHTTVQVATEAAPVPLHAPH
jgi:cobalt-zinc-cadmium efflux system protein